VEVEEGQQLDKEEGEEVEQYEVKNKLPEPALGNEKRSVFCQTSNAVSPNFCRSIVPNRCLTSWR